MQLSNNEYVGRGLDLLIIGLRPFVEQELRAAYGDEWFDRIRADLPPSSPTSDAKLFDFQWDSFALLVIIWKQWGSVFARKLRPTDRALVSLLWDARNAWAHQRPFTSDDAHAAIYNAERLLKSISKDASADVELLRREVFDMLAAERPAKTAMPVKPLPTSAIGTSRLKPPSGPDEWWVYENWPTNKALVHRAACSFCNSGTGTGRGTPGKHGRFLGPFESRDVALKVAAETGRARVDECRFCE